MKKSLLSISLLAMLLLAAFTNPGKKTNPTTDSSKPAAVETSRRPEFTPFDVMEVNLTVKDYSAWKKGFEDDSVARKASGLELVAVGRSAGNPNNLMIVLTASEVQKAKDFAANPRLKEAMQNSGVISKPDMNYFHVVRFNPDAHEKQWVAVTHKVKDYDVWLKAFDAEGSANRAARGLADVLVARGVDDPNTVQLVFDITDMDKAKAGMASEDLKKVMRSAGVVSAPKIEFYTDGE